MALQYVGGTSNAGTGASYTVSLNGTLTGGLSSSPAAGDIVVVFSGFGNTASVAPTCTGNNSGAYDSASNALYSNDTWDTNFRAFYKVQGSTPDTSLTIGRVNNTTYGGATTVHVWRGVNTTTPLDVTTTTTSASNQSSAALNPPAITPVTSGAIVIAGGAGTMPAAGTAGYTAIGTMSNTVTQYGNGSTADTSVIMASFAWTSGPYDPVTATGGTQNNTSSSWAGVTLALRPQPDPRTGNLAATESGADTASASGDVVVQGSASASEATTEDVFFASGALSSGIAGDLVATESGADTAEASGDVFVTGTMSPTEAGADTASISGDVFVAGAFAVNETGQDTASASGGVIVAGALAVSEAGEDVAALAGIVPVQGDVSATEDGEDVFAGSSLSSSSGDMAASEDGQDGFFAEGSAETVPPATPNEIAPIGGAFNIPTRQQMAVMARKQRIALGILAPPAQKKAKQAAKRLAKMTAEQAPVEEIRQQLVEIPQMWMPAIEPAFIFYLRLEQSKLAAQQQIDRIKAQEKEIAAVLAEIERISIIQREEEEAVMLFMQLIAAE